MCAVLVTFEASEIWIDCANFGCRYGEGHRVFQVSREQEGAHRSPVGRVQGVDQPRGTQSPPLHALRDMYCLQGDCRFLWTVFICEEANA
jgi:hypothetical protein